MSEEKLTGINAVMDKLARYHEQMSIYAGEHREILASDVVDILEDLQDTLPAGWTRCADSLPPTDKTIRVWMSFHTLLCNLSERGVWNRDHFEWDNGKVIEENNVPIAWQPYFEPMPYKESHKKSD